MRRSFMVAMLACAAIGCGDDTEDVVANAASGAGGAGASLGDPPAVGEDAGVDACAPGFDAVDGGCAAVLPSVPCDPGMIAVPGDAAGRPIADCGSSTWGTTPVEATTV